MKKIITLGFVFFLSLNNTSADQKTANDKNVKITGKERITFSGEAQDFDPNKWEKSSENSEIVRVLSAEEAKRWQGDSFVTPDTTPIENEEKQDAPINYNFYGVLGSIFFYGLCFFGLLYAISINLKTSKKADPL